MAKGIIALTFAYVMSQFYRSFLTVLAPVLSQDLEATTSQLSLASGAWFIVFALAQFPIGYWLDTYGPRRTASYILLIGGAGGAVMFAMATSPMHLILAMGLIGLGCAPVLMASFFIFAKQLPAARFALFSALLIATGSSGNIFGAKPLADLATYFGWRETMFVLAFITAIIAIAIFFTVKDPQQEPQKFDRKSALASILEILRIKALWPIFVLISVNYALPAGIRGLWAGPYLQNIFNFDTTAIGYATLWMAISMVIGTLIYGPLDQWLGTRKWVAFFGNALLFLSVFLLTFLPIESAGLAIALLMLCGLAGSSYALLMAHGKAFLPAHLTGRGVTLMNFFSIGGVGVLQWITGRIVTDEAITANSAGAFQSLFGFYALCIGIALVAYLFSRDNANG